MTETVKFLQVKKSNGSESPDVNIYPIFKIVNIGLPKKLTSLLKFIRILPSVNSPNVRYPAIPIPR